MVSGQSTQIQPIGYAVTTTGSSAQAIGQNPSRKGLWFHNPSASANIYIAPAPITAAVGGAGSILIFPGNWVQFDSLSASCAWNAIGPGALTILEWVA